MTLILADPPALEPITLIELKAHLRLDHDSEDDLLNSLITTARHYLEERTGLALITQVWRLCLDDWQKSDCVTLGKTPVSTINEIEQFDSHGTATVLDLSGMLLDGKSRPARLYTSKQSKPEQVINGIEITLIAGFGEPIDVPDLIKRAILIHVSHMYEFRGVVKPDMQPASEPSGYSALIAPWLRRGL
jgi:uncharacterized phiE125 gp8 family phage protein